MSIRIVAALISTLFVCQPLSGVALAPDSGKHIKQEAMMQAKPVTQEKIQAPIQILVPHNFQYVLKNWSTFEGTWYNTNKKTRSLPKLQTFSKNNQFWVHAWGSCVPKNCDWGQAKGQLSGNTAKITWDQKFVVRTMTLTFDGNKLTATTASKYRDNRPPRTSTETFKRVQLTKTNPAVLIDRGQWVLNAPSGGGAGDANSAEEDFEHAIELAAASGDKREHVDAILKVGGSFVHAGDLAKAEAYFDRAIEVFRPPSETNGHIATLVQIARVARVSIDPLAKAPNITSALALSRRYAQRTLDTSALVDSQIGTAQANFQLGMTALRAKEFEAASEKLTIAYKMQQVMQRTREAGRSMAAIGAVYEAQARGPETVGAQAAAPSYKNVKKAELAIGYLARAEKLHTRAEDIQSLWQTAYNRGQVLQNLGRHEDARKAFEFALATIAKTDGGDEKARQLSCRAGVVLTLPDGTKSGCAMMSTGLATMMVDEVGDEEDWSDWEDWDEPNPTPDADEEETDDTA